MATYEMSERMLRKTGKRDTLTLFPFFCLRINEYKKDVVLVPRRTQQNGCIVVKQLQEDISTPESDLLRTYRITENDHPTGNK